MKTYHGKRTEHGAEVRVEQSGVQDSPLQMRFDLRNHSPNGADWGYNGSGPAQLALAICCDVLRDDKRAERVYQEFKARVVAGIDGNEWWLEERLVLREIERIEQEQAVRTEVKT